MIVEQKYRIKLSEINRKTEATNKTILAILEDVGSKHSDIAGYGIMQIPETHLTWVLLDWKVEILRRPKYGEEIIAKTWSRGAKRYYAFRDFEICDKDGNVIVKAASKWALINIEKQKMVTIDDEILENYKTETKKSFDDELEKMKEPEEFENIERYKVKKSDIDINNHMHNVNYLELANEALPDNLYQNAQFNNFRIMYKKEIKLGETVLCKYSNVDKKNVITIKDETDELLHAIVELF